MTKILKTPIKNIPSSKEFKEICESNRFTTLQDILNITVEKLEYEFGFSKRMIVEFMGIAKKYGVEEMVKEGDFL